MNFCRKCREDAATFARSVLYEYQLSTYMLSEAPFFTLCPECRIQLQVDAVKGRMLNEPVLVELKTIYNLCAELTGPHTKISHLDNWCRVFKLDITFQITDK